MKKIIAILLVVLLILSMAVPAYAVTPALKIPDMPEISNIKIEAKMDDQAYKNAVRAWFAEHPIKFVFFKIKPPDGGV